MEKRHIHIFENGKEYSQNEDGSPHKGGRGSPSNSVKKHLKKTGIWDWDSKRDEYINNLKETLKRAKKASRGWNDEIGKCIIISENDQYEFCTDEDFVEAGGTIERDNVFLPNTSIYFIPVFVPLLTPFYIPSVYPIPAFMF